MRALTLVTQYPPAHLPKECQGITPAPGQLVRRRLRHAAPAAPADAADAAAAMTAALPRPQPSLSEACGCFGYPHAGDHVSNICITRSLFLVYF